MGCRRGWQQIASGVIALVAACGLVAGCSAHNQTSCAMPDGGSAPGDGAQAQGDGGIGNISVGGTVTNCPFISSISIAPNELDVGAGGQATVFASATVPGGGTPTFSWSAESGVFGTPSAPETTFECTVPGIVKLTVTATFDGCDARLSTAITCLAADGG
jgi:hypothetical protein